MDRHGFQVNYLATILKLDKLMAESGLVVPSLPGSGELSKYKTVFSVLSQTNRGLQKYTAMSNCLLYYCKVCRFLG